MKLQASSISRIFECPGSAKLADNIHDDLGYYAFKDAASFGRNIHEISEKILTGNIKKLSDGLISLGYIKGSYEYITGFTIVEQYTKYIKTFFNRRLKKYSDAHLLVEEKYRVQIEDFDCVFKSDAMIISNETEDSMNIDIFDLKTGNYDYTDSASEQLEFSLNILAVFFQKKITGTYHIVQPNYYDEFHRFISAVYNIDSPDDYFLSLFDLIKKDTVRSGGHCKMCPAILNCPVMRVSLDIIHQIAELEDIETITDEILEFIFLNKANIENFLSAASDALKNKLESGHFFKSIELKERYGKRFWENEEKVKKELSYLKNKIYEPRKLLSPSQMEKIAGKKNIEGLYNKIKYNILSVRENPFK